MDRFSPHWKLAGVKYHPGRQQPFTVWRGERVIFFAESIDECRMWEPGNGR